MVAGFIYKHAQSTRLILHNDDDNVFFWVDEGHLPGAIIATTLHSIHFANGFADINGADSLVKLPAKHKLHIGSKIKAEIIAPPQKGKGAKAIWAKSETPECPPNIYHYIAKNYPPYLQFTTNNRAIWAEFRQKLPEFSIECMDNSPGPNERAILDYAGQTSYNAPFDLLIHCHATAVGTIIDIDSHRAFGLIKNDNDVIYYNQKICPALAQIIALKSLSGLVMIDFLKPKNRTLMKNILPNLKAQLKNHFVRGQVLGFGPAGLCECTFDWGVAPINERINF